VAKNVGTLSVGQVNRRASYGFPKRTIAACENAAVRAMRSGVRAQCLDHFRIDR
jgi:hypothetical protein